MKKLLILISAIIMLIPSLCLAAEPVIKSDTRTFNPLTGVYDLQGNVYVQFPAHDTMLTITGDQTMVSLYKLEVHGQGNITLTYDDLKFHCDKVDVYHKTRTAYVTGSCNFVTGAVSISADKGSFNWKTKLASFEGNVKVNGVPQKGAVTYNVLSKSFVGEKPTEAVPQTKAQPAVLNPVKAEAKVLPVTESPAESKAEAQPATSTSDTSKPKAEPVKKAA